MNCFVESMYSGELENCDKTNFRDLNKMGHVFDVTWFVERCLKYFTELVDKVTGRCYEDILFVAEEAWFVEEHLNKCELMDMVIDKLNGIGTKKSRFLKEFTTNLNEIPINKLKMVVRVAGTDVGILAAILAAHLNKMDPPGLTNSSRYLFQNINFEQCFSDRRYRDITNVLIGNILDGSFNEDFKCAVKSISNLNQPQEKEEAYNKKQLFSVVYFPMQEFLHMEWNSLCNFLSHSNVICTICQYFEALHMWMRISRNDLAITAPRVYLSDSDYIKDMIDIKHDRGWGKISKTYLEFAKRSSSATVQLYRSFLNCDELSYDDGAETLILKSKEDYSPDGMFNSENLTILLLSVSENKFPACRKKSKCGIMVKRILRKKGEDILSFSLEIVQCDEVNDDNEVHHHNEFDISKNAVGILLEVTSGTTTVFTPMPFNCLPHKNANGHWHWGFHQFCGHGKRQCETPVKFTRAHEVNACINIVVLLNSKRSFVCLQNC